MLLINFQRACFFFSLVIDLFSTIIRKIPFDVNVRMEIARLKRNIYLINVW